MNQVVKIIQRYTALPNEAITDDAILKDDLGVDSVTYYEIMSALETEYEIEEIPDDELLSVKTVKDIKELVQKYALSI
jgi:acyl carrier protein